MKYTEAMDSGVAPEIFVSGISRIDKLGPGTVRLTFYSQYEQGNHVVLHLVADAQQWVDTLLTLVAAAQDRHEEPRLRLVEGLH